LRIDSAPGTGTIVRLYFRCIAETELHRPQPEDGDSLVGGSETVLVFEDDEDVRSMTVQFLETLGYDALTARNAQEALQVAASARIDLVVSDSDIVMPGGMNGVDLARELRRRHRAICVILASGYAAGTENFGKADATQEFLVLAKLYQQTDIARAVRAAPRGLGGSTFSSDRSISVIARNASAVALSCKLSGKASSHARHSSCSSTSSATASSSVAPCCAGQLASGILCVALRPDASPDSG